jgi:voltage-gated potassium channel
MNEPPASHREPPVAPSRGGGRWRFSAVELLIAIVVLIVASPFVSELPGGTGIEAALMTVVMLSAVLAVGGRRGTLCLGALLAAPAVLCKWLHHFRPNLVPHAVYLVAALAFLGFVIAHLLRFVLRAERVNAEVLCASIAAYLLLGILWGLGYSLVAQLNPHAFAVSAPAGTDQTMDGPNAFYFSFVTLSTVGYGDITPVSRVARMLAFVEAMTGLLYMTVLVARLVSLYSAPHPPEERRADDR